MSFNISLSKNTITIVVFELIGDVAISDSKGELLHHSIDAEFRFNNAVHLDFHKVRIFSSNFFSCSIGKLLNNYTYGYLNQNLRITNLNKTGTKILDLTLETARSRSQLVLEKQTE